MKMRLIAFFVLLMAFSASSHAQTWQPLDCPDGMDNRIEVEFRALSPLKFDGADGSKDNLHYTFRITNHYSATQQAWIVVTTRQGSRPITSNNGPITLYPEKPFTNSSAVDAYGSAVLGCRVTLKAPGAARSDQGQQTQPGTPVAPGVNVLEFPSTNNSPGHCHKVVRSRLERGVVARVTIENICPMPRVIIVCFADSIGRNDYARDIGERPGYSCRQRFVVSPGATSDFSHVYSAPVPTASFDVVDDVVFTQCGISEWFLEAAVYNPPYDEEDRTVHFVIRNKWSNTVDVKYCLSSYARCIPNILVRRLKPGERVRGEVKSNERLDITCATSR